MNTIENVCAEIKGKQGWGFLRTYGSAIIVEFGAIMHRKNSAKDHGESHLLVQGGAWRLLSKEGIIIGSDDTADDIDRVVKSLSLGIVEEFRIDSLTFDISISFERTMLQFFTSSVGESAEDCWILYHGEEGAWAVQPGPTLTFFQE